MKNEMWSHEGSTLDFRQGYREGIEHSIEVVKELIQDLVKDKKINQAAWVEVAKEWLEDEISMYQVGDEER